MAFGYKKSITIDHTKVPNTDQSNFPVLVSVTDANLKTVANGGHVTSASGFDICFYTASDLSGTKLAHEIESYDATTGAILMWVKVPTVATASDTVIYIGYGDSGITTSQEDKATLWADYIAVYHFGTPSTLSVADSKGVNNGTNSGVTASTGKIGGAGNFVAASSQYINVGSHASLKPTGNFSITAWIKNSTSAYLTIFSCFDYPSSKYVGYRLSQFDSSFSNVIALNTFINTTATTYGRRTNSAYNNGAWHKITAIHNDTASTEDVFADTTDADTALALGYADPVYAGTPVGLIGALNLAGTKIQYWNGQIDELRIYNGLLTKDWSDTEYNNQNDPASFHTFGSEEAIVSNQISGTASLSFSSSATLTGRGALASTASFTFGSTATIKGRGLVSATSSLTFSQTATIRGKGVLSASSLLTFSQTATLTGRGLIAATVALTFGYNATITGRGILSGNALMQFGSNSTLTGRGALAGSIALIFESSASLGIHLSASGSSVIAFSCTGNLTGRGFMNASSYLHFISSAILGFKSYPVEIISLISRIATELVLNSEITTEFSGKSRIIAELNRDSEITTEQNMTSKITTEKNITSKVF